MSFQEQVAKTMHGVLELKEYKKPISELNNRIEAGKLGKIYDKTIEQNLGQKEGMEH